MSKAIAIIGANYGDEGKGMATDFFARQYKAALVVRGNGGPQAGHTVVDGDRRHVFGHVGSGAFAKVPTYLSSKFIVNPMMLHKEIRELGERQTIIASRDCRVTTIYDMAINSLIELKRGVERHGSCGMGINETVTRNAEGYFLDLGTVKNSYRDTAGMVQMIHGTWVPSRLEELGIKREDFEIDGPAKMYFDMLDLSVSRVAEALLHYGDLMLIEDPKRFILKEDVVIVEGAQGLMLDEYLGDFPHVTRSVTGLASSIQAAAECGKTRIAPVYMSRAYATRHGAGPLKYEGLVITDKELETDHTNIHNDWQGTIRYAPLDLHMLAWFIREDMKRGRAVGQLFGVEVLEPKLFITCMDQLGELVHVGSRNKELIKMKTIKLVSYIEKVMGIEVCATSHGPSANDVQLLHAVL